MFILRINVDLRMLILLVVLALVVEVELVLVEEVELVLVVLLVVEVEPGLVLCCYYKQIFRGFLSHLSMLNSSMM
jgi:hypothetical protein